MSVSPSPLPVREVVLFNSGVGYFQHAGSIHGPTTLTFSFRTDQINDLLKSLVLFDPAGQVEPVTYAAPDPIGRSLGQVGGGVGESDTLGAVLRRFQGVRVRITTSSRTLEGRILSVSTQQVPGDKKDVPLTVEVVNLLTETGLVALPLSGSDEMITGIQLLDERRQRELQSSLDLLASGGDRQKKEVSVHFGGDKAREVRLGYLLEASIWKPSYRLVLNDKEKTGGAAAGQVEDKKASPGEKGGAYLQGWAVVENTTDEDWREISLSLVSGRPISFIQDLYTPLYVSRPVVQSQVEGSPLPELHGGAIEENGQALSLNRPEGLASDEAVMAAPASPVAAGGFGGGAGFGRDAPSRKMAGLRSEMRDSLVKDLSSSVAAQASGQERGELFEYLLSQPISVPSHQAAMVPILSNTLDGKKVSLYNAGSDPLHPMLACELHNTTGLHLAGGPITVFDEGTYAGDSQIETLQPQETRLLTYAVDLAVDGKTETTDQPQETLSVRADSGVLWVMRKLRQQFTYTFKNKDAKPRTLLVEQPIQSDWNLVEPKKADETTADRYRFRVEVPAQATGKLDVRSERPLTESYSLRDTDVNFLLSYAQNGTLSEKLRAALKELVQRRRKIVELQQQRQNAEAEIKTIGDEQARIRENMKQLDHQSDLYRQYVAKLTNQENRIEELRTKIQKLREQEAAAQEDLKKYVDSLNIEG